MKVYVYAIARDERAFVKRWMDSMREADGVFVLDTGSSDGTAEALRAAGASVTTKTYDTWRFDAPRNDSMKLVPSDADLLVCTDLDETFTPGWRARLETVWTEAVAAGRSPTTARYEYVWRFDAEGRPETLFWYEKIHRPGICRWTHPVHEILDYGGVAKECVTVPGMRLEHRPDPKKSRGQYLALLELSVYEDPEDDRNMHYLGREYMFCGRWGKAIETLKRHLALPRARWRAERASSMRFIAHCYGKLNRPDLQELWLWRAIAEEGEQREAALDLAEILYARQDWHALACVCEICLARKNRVMTYLSEARCWGARPYDLYSLGLWYDGRHREGLVALDAALALEPDNARLQDNRRIMVDCMAKEGET